MPRRGIAAQALIARKHQEYRKNIKKYERILFGILGSSFLIFLGIAAYAVYKIGYSNFLETVASIKLGYYAIALLVVFFAYVIRFPKWELYMKRLGVRIGRLQNFLIYMSMYSMDITPGRWGRVVVSYTINRLTGTKFSKTLPAVVADIFTDFAGFAFVAVVAAIFVGQYVIVAIVATILLLLPFVFLYSKRAYSLFSKRLHNKKLFRRLFEVGDKYFRHNKLLGIDVYANSMAYTIPSMAINAVSLYFVMLAFGVNLSLHFIPIVIFIFSMSTLLGMLTGLPANLGITDATLFGFLLAFFGGDGIGVGLASVITIFARLANVWFVQLFGFSSLAYTIRYWRRQVK
ncbi:MAG: flippase-like domain-containing protein [Candidatus Micrarchaeota archaeon]|nr:flippase-like domain-containing protein [Candidatus Micrarchaeota archaeon]MDE1805084.1 flippase-like domain-containing protein [Candidatus Micrarchaeota archaeon]MDE1846563.1 flippase-like domain-containing protein [Candidatus Micrarchaeota archaeon]